MTERGVVNIRGKQYKTVVLRVNEFREKFKPDDGWCIRTWLISNENDRVIIQATICDKDDHVVATGFAEEVRGQGKINKTSALENCETSAIGRALAAFGLGGEEYCSADELLSALDQQKELESGPPKKAPASSRDPISLMAEKLDTLAEDNDEQEVKAFFSMFLKQCDCVPNAMRLDDLRQAAVTDQWPAYRLFKTKANQAFDAGFNEG